MMERIPLLIVGGGIGGLAMALAASRVGQTAHVLEKSEGCTESGAGLQLAPNAMWALERLGILTEIQECAVIPRRMVTMDAVQGGQLGHVEFSNKFLSRFGYPYVLLHRGDLLAVELAACQKTNFITIECKKQAVKIEDLGEGARVTCSDGSIYECDALIGADGLWSKTRKLICDDGEPICSRSVSYRGTIPIAEAPEGVDLDSLNIWIGPNIVHVQHAICRGHIWNQSVAFVSDNYRENSGDWGIPAELDAIADKMCGTVRTAVAKLKSSRRWVLSDRRAISNWTLNRITLLGDAAHPMLPHVSQGACQALEDAVCLGACLRQFSGDLSRSFVAYQSARIARTARVQMWARCCGEALQLRGTAAATRNALLRKRSPEDYEQVEWLFGYRGDEPWLL